MSNFRLGWCSARFDIAGWVENLNDELYFVQKAPANFATSIGEALGSPEGSFQTFLGAPRTYGATLRMSF